MKLSFGFLSAPGRYSAEVPSGIESTSEQIGVAVLNGVARSIQYSGKDRAAPSFQNGSPRARAVRNGVAVTRYSQHSDPRLEFLSWDTGRGWLWTHAAEDEGEDAVEALLGGLRVSEAGEHPRVDYSGQVSGGRLAERGEREATIFHAQRQPATLWSVSFTYAGAYAADDAGEYEGVLRATYATEHGITVTCDGWARDRDALHAAARGIARSVRRER